MNTRFALASSLLALTASQALHAQDAAPASPAPASTAAEPTEAAPVGDLVVTGRKRSERLLQAPLSITAYSDEKLQQLNLTSVSQIATITPGFKFEQQSFSNGFRLLAQIRFRGIVSASPRPNNQTGAIFVDGSYVAAGSASLNTDDLERVEVIKGPQSAYFGRNTFAGAVNFITRTPTEDFHAAMKAEYKEYRGYDLGGSAEGAIVPGVLAARVMVDTYRNGGQYSSGDGSRVGTQETQSIAGSLYFTPGTRLKMRGRISYQHDADYGNLLENYSGTIANCKVGAVAFFCGAVPHAGDTYTSVTGQKITINHGLTGQDTRIQAPALVQAGRPYALSNLLSNATGAMNDVGIYKDVPRINHFGSEDTVLRTSLAADYDLGGGYSIAANAGYGEFRSVSLRDFDATLGVAQQRPQCAATLAAAAYQQCLLNNTTFLVVPFVARDFSGDLRVSSPRDKRLRVMVGVSYYKQWLEGNISGAGKSLVAGTGAITPFVNNDRDRSFAQGVFGAISFDILRTLTIDLEGRYQKDAARQFTQTGSFAANTIAYTPISTDFNKFLPRAILTWKPTGQTTFYGSYSVGELAGVANVSFNNTVAQVAANPRNPFGTTDTAAVRKALAGLLGYSGDVPEVVPAQELRQAEIGWKQSFWRGRGSFTLAGYHINWNNIQTTAAVTPTQDLTGTGILTPIGATLPGKARIWGVEAAFNLRPTDRISLTLQGEKVDAKYTDYVIYGVAAQVAGPTNVMSGVGKTPIQYPTFSGFGSARYTLPIDTQTSLYGQVEGNLTGRQYLDEANVAWISPYATANIRAGVNFKGYGVEVYATNLFDYGGPAGGRRNSLGDGTTGITLFPALRRTIGVRGSAKF
jgi:iron complex outermembrane receptor protein